MQHREIESIIRRLKSADDSMKIAYQWATDSMRELEDIDKALEQIEYLHKRMATKVITEALQASMKFMVNKYGHSSNEVKEVEKFIAIGAA
jgi:hypothetical protein